MLTRFKRWIAERKIDTSPEFEPLESSRDENDLVVRYSQRPRRVDGVSNFVANGVSSASTNTTKKVHFDRKYEELMKMININYSISTDVEIKQDDPISPTSPVSPVSPVSPNFATEVHHWKMTQQSKFHFPHERNRRQHQLNSEFIKILNEMIKSIEVKPAIPLPEKLVELLEAFDEKELNIGTLESRSNEISINADSV